MRSKSSQPDNQAPRKTGRRHGGPNEGTIGHEPRGIDRTIADADKAARTGSNEERVRNTPPAGPWNDTSRD
jgi:hypothetical protein